MNKLFKPFKNSCNGLKLAWKEDHSFRISSIQVLVASVFASLLTYLLHANAYFWLMLIASMFPIIIVEAVNCAVEAVTDKASPERSPLAKKAKDIGSAAVLLTRILAAICWLVLIGKAINS